MRKKTGVWRHMAAVLAAAGVAAGILSGCGGAGKEPGEGKTVSRVEGAGAGQENKKETEEAGGGTAAMGRYVEMELALPGLTEDERFIALFYGNQGILELYTASREEGKESSDVRRFLREGEGWRQDEGWWERVKPRDLEVDIRRVFYGLDENYYFTAMTTGDSYICQLYQIREDGASVELIPEAFQAEAGKKYGLIPTKVEVGKDGNILIHAFHDCIYYTPDGKRLFSMEKSMSGSSESSEGYLTEEEFVTKVDGGVARYGLADGKLIETISYEGLDKSSEESTVLLGDGNGGIYVANEKGLAHVNQGGSLWELLIDGSLNTMGMKSMYLEAFLIGDQEDYYGAFVSGGGKGIMLCRYVYDPDTAAVPPVTLTVYGLEESPTVRQAAAVFQKGHPDVRVEVLNGAGQDGKISEDTIRALNTELLGGQGADVLILDGLPVRAYQEKGILMDLREVFDTVQKEDPVMGQVLAEFTESDGAVYKMPARIAVPLVIGEEPAVRAFKSLEAIRDYEGEVPLIYTTTYENLLRMAASVRYEEMFGKEGKNLTEDMLVKYLEAVKALADKNGARRIFTEEEMERYYVSNHAAEYGICGTDTHFDQGNCGCGTQNMTGMFAAVIFEAVADKHPEAVQGTINGIYFPQVLAGVNQNTSQPELAREFVRMLFSTEVQKEELFDGLPVGLRAQQLNCETEKDYSVGTGYGDYGISASWPELEKRKEIYQMIGTVSVPVMIDETVMRMIVDGAGDYLDGKVTAKQAAGGIYRQIVLYRAEQE